MIKYIFNVKQCQRSGGAALEQQLPGYPLPWWPSSGPCPQGECRRCLVTSLPGPLPREEFDSLQFGPAQCRNPPHAAALVIKLSLALLPSWWARWAQNLRGAPPTSPECCGICHPRALRLLSPARQANPCMCLAIRGVQGLLRLRGPWGHQRDPPGPFTCSPQKIWGPMGSPCLRGAHHQALGVHLTGGPARSTCGLRQEQAPPVRWERGRLQGREGPWLAGKCPCGGMGLGGTPESWCDVHRVCPTDA